MVDSFVKGIIQLVESALTGREQPLPENLDFEMVYEFAKAHNVVTLLYYGLKNSKANLSAELDKKFFLSAASAAAFFEQQQRGFGELCTKFDREEIDYLVLKGAAIRKEYPQEDFRAMGDIDFLIRAEQYEKIQGIMADLGYQEEEEWNSVFSWRKKLLHVELHQTPIPTDVEDYHNYYKDGWHLAKKCDGSQNRYEMSNEDSFIYIFVHFAKHYRIAGIGIRQLVDLYILLEKHSDMDMEYIKTELEKLSLLKFFENVKRTISVWFYDVPSDEIVDFITQRVMRSGVFGTREAFNQSTAIKEGKKNNVKHIRLRRFMNALFMPYKDMCILFPVLKKLPILLPVMWLWRFVRILLFRTSRFNQRMGEIKSISSSKLKRYEEELDVVGLNYGTKEGL